MITFSFAGINCEKNFAHSVFPAAGSPQKTKFIFAKTQFTSSPNISAEQYSAATASSGEKRTAGRDFRIEKDLPETATDSCTIVILKFSVSASKTFSIWLKLLLTSFATLPQNCSKKDVLILSFAVSILRRLLSVVTIQRSVPL